MFQMFPFLTGNNNQYGSNMLSYLLSDEFISGITQTLLSSDVIKDMADELMDDDSFNIEFKDRGEFYSIKGYLPGITAKDVSIDFEKNKAILTIKRKQVYSSSSGNTTVVAMIQSSGDIIKNFYIDEVDVTKLRASFNKNVLIIEMPKIRSVENYDNSIIVDVDEYKETNK